MRSHRYLIAGIIAASLFAATRPTFAGVVSNALSFRLQIAGGGTTATVANGQVEHLELWADITGPAQTGLLDAIGSFIFAGAGSGTYSNAAVQADLSASGFSPGSPVGAFWGPTDPFADPGLFFAARAGGSPTPVVGAAVELGTIDFTTSLTPGQTVTLSFLPRNRPTVVDQLWVDGYVPATNTGNARTDNDSAVFANQVVLTAAVPEPASLSLLALGAVGLLARRKR